MKKYFSSAPYQMSLVAVDAVILTIKDHKLLIYLQNREKEPFKNLYELPGGLLKEGETAEETLSRKVIDLIGIKNVSVRQFYTFTDIKRDPRGRSISIGFLVLISSDKITNFDSFFPVDKLKNLAFDHQNIIDRALAYTREHLDYHLIKQFVAKVFPLNDLQIVYEILSNKKLDNRNFRKKILESGLIIESAQKQSSVKHRPAKLYKFNINE